MLRTRDQEREVQQARAAAWSRFIRHLVPFVLVNVMLGIGNWLSGGPPWVLFVVLGWGIGLALHLLRVLNASPEQLRHDHELREARLERRRQRRRLRAGAPVRAPEPQRVRAQDSAPKLEQHADDDWQERRVRQQ